MTIVDGALALNGQADILALGKPIVEASVDLYFQVLKDLKPIPAKSHYTFNLRDVSKIVQGVLMMKPAAIPSKETLAKLQQEFLNVVEPPVAALLHSGQVLMRQKLALSQLTTYIDHVRLKRYRELVGFLCDMRTKRVYNFTRSGLYDRIANSRRMIELRR